MLMGHAKIVHRMRTRTILSVFVGVQLLLVACLIALAIAMQQTQLHAEEAVKRRILSYQLADELRQSSDDLTRFARTYVTTGDDRFEKYFREILAIRNGELPRPEGYEGIYWDLVAVGLGKDWLEGETSSLRSRMLEAGFTNEEFDKLSLAQNRSDTLVQLENVAMNAIKGRFDDGTGTFTIEGPADRELAIALLHGEKYHEAKASIMAPIGDFMSMIERRTQAEVDFFNKLERTLILMAIVVSCLLLISTVSSVILVRRRMLRPIETMALAAERVSAGDLTARANVGGTDEIALFSRTFDTMVDSVVEQVNEVEAARVAVADSHARLNHLMATSPAALCSFEAAGDYAPTFISENVRELFGYEPSEYLADPHFVPHRIHPEDQERIEMAVGGLFKAGHVVNEYRFLCKDGNYCWVSDELRVIYGDAGEPVEVVGSWSDISVRKEAEAALDASRTHLNHLLATSPAVLCSFEAAGDYYAPTFISENVRKLFGYEPSEYLADPNFVPNHIHPEDRERIGKAVQRLLKTGHVVNEYRFRRKDGNYCWVSDELRVIYDNAGEAVEVVGSWSDISARKEADDKIVKQADALKKQYAHSERLLLNVLPASIADRIKSGEETIAESFPEVSVLFSDIVGFTEMAARVGAKEVVEILNEVFGMLDDLAKQHGIEKIKTIGDCYMAVAGVPDRSHTHAQEIAKFALDVQQALIEYSTTSGKEVSMRTGIHTGTVVAGIVGHSKFAYDLWGDVVNVASRMESTGEPGTIQVSDAVRIRLQDDFAFKLRGDVEIKGKGSMQTWFLTGRHEQSSQNSPANQATRPSDLGDHPDSLH